MLSPEEINRLRQAAEEKLPAAYAPYSGIRVSAALLDDRGGIHTGCNVENSSYSLTVCAERNALFSAVSRGCRRFKGMVVVSDREQVKSPCGACRQTLWEFAPDLPLVFFCGARQHFYNLRDLLPEAFSLEPPEDGC